MDGSTAGPTRSSCTDRFLPGTLSGGAQPHQEGRNILSIKVWILPGQGPPFAPRNPSCRSQLHLSPPSVPKFPSSPWLHVPAGQTDVHTQATRAVGSSQGTTRATQTHPHAHPCHQHCPHRTRREASGLTRPPGGTPSIPFLSPNGAKWHIHPSPCSLQLQDGLQRAARSWGRGGQGDAEGTGQPREAAGSGAGKAKRGGREGSRWSPPQKK